jgi:hypothetical protein
MEGLTVTIYCDLATIIMSLRNLSDLFPYELGPFLMLKSR